MTLDRKDYKSAIPQLEGRLAKIEKLGKDVFNKFEDIAHKTQLDAAEAEKKVAALDYQIDSINVVTEYQLQTTGLDPVEANWSTTMPSITYSSYNGKTLWCRSVTYQNDIAVRKTAPQKVQLMDGLYTFVNSASGNTGWTMIDGDFIQTGKIASTNGYSYFDIDNNSFQMKDASTVALSNSVLAWQNGLLYVKGKIAVGSSSTDQKYYTEMTGGGFDIVANDVTLAHIGYASGASESGTAIAPYYIFGLRRNGITSGNYSVTEGIMNASNGYASHAEGSWTTANDKNSHAEGYYTWADKDSAHAEGFHTEANGYYSHAQNYYTVASGNAQTAIGRCNDNKSTNAFEIGNGTTDEPSNAFEVDWNGNIKAGGLDCGKESITPVANQVTSKAVTFNHEFSSAPNVVATAQSALPGVVSEVTVSDVTTTGFTIYLLRTSATSTNIFWIAML